MTEELDWQLSVIVPCAKGDLSWKGLLSDLQILPKESEIVLISPDPEPIDDINFWNEQLLPEVRWIENVDGRAACMNRGAMEARGRYYWFVHGDCKVPRLSTYALVELFSEENDWDDVFYFDHHFLGDGPKWVFLNSALVNFRSKYLSLPMGHQGFAMHRKVFERIGGFDESLKFGEDHQMVWEARRKDISMTRIPGALFTSARRYRDGGWIPTTIHQAMNEGRSVFTGALKFLKYRMTDI